MRTLSFAEAVDQALLEEIRRDRRVLCLGAPGALPEILGTLPDDEARLTPIAESSTAGMAVGAALSGLRPVVHFGMVTFAFLAMDQIVNQASKLRYMSGGQAALPIVFRARMGAGTQSAAQHSQSPYSMFMHIAGLKVILPSTPADMYGLLKSAVRDDDPVFSFEHQGLLSLREEVPVEDADFTVPLGKADIKRPGVDVTIVAFGALVHEALKAADALSRDGIDAEVVDPRTLVPLDVETIRTSVARTRRLVIADEAPPMCSAASEIAALVVEDAHTFARLRTRIVRVCSAPVPVPFSPEMERFVLPDADKVAHAVRELVTQADA